MAIEVKVGTILTDIKKGQTAKGEWAVAKIKSDKGFDAIDVWATNPQDVGNEAMQVGEILSVKKTAKKYQAKDGTEKWADVYSVQAKFIPSYTTGFSQLDEDCPF